MTHVSLFTGIGGLDLAAEAAGFETVLQVERDPYCLKVLDKHWPKVRRITDVREVTNQEVEGEVTLLSGGFPCQPFSQPGKRKGADDDRYLWPEMLRVVRELRPSWIVAENVPGLLSIDDGAEFERVCSDLEREGYEVQPIVLPAASVGAPHRRDRVFIVAYRGGEARPVANSHGHRQQARRLSVRPRRQDEAAAEFAGPCSDARSEWWAVEPAVCGMVDGLPSGLDGGVEGRTYWDAGEWPVIPRVVTGMKNRAARLRALGNAVVPQQAYPIFATIAAILGEA